MLPPQIRPLGDLDEGEPPFEPGDLAVELPAAIGSLRRRFELTRLHSGFISGLAEQSDAAELLALAADKAQTQQLAASAQVVDVLTRFPTTLSAEQLTQLLPGTVRQSADASLQRLPAAVMQQIETALGQAMAGYEQRLRDSGQLLQNGAEAVAAQVRRTEKLNRNVAWKALARGGPMLTKQYAAAQGGDVLLDWSALPTHLDEEQRLSRLTAWVLRAEQDGRRYGLLLPQTHIAPELGRDHRDRCLRELALFGIAPEDRA